MVHWLQRWNVYFFGHKPVLHDPSNWCDYKNMYLESLAKNWQGGNMEMTTTQMTLATQHRVDEDRELWHNSLCSRKWIILSDKVKNELTQLDNILTVFFKLFIWLFLPCFLLIVMSPMFPDLNKVQYHVLQIATTAATARIRAWRMALKQLLMKCTCSANSI